MQQELVPEYSEVLQKQEILPCVSIILPFEPKMTPLAEIMHRLKCAIDSVKVKLLSEYKPVIAAPVIKKLQSLLHTLNYNTHKKTIAIFVSPLIEKVYYLDIAVEEKIIIDDSFEIRDLIFGKKQILKYLLAELGSNWTKIYLGNANQFVKVISNELHNINAIDSNAFSAASHHIDKNKEKEILLDQFLKHTDKGLTLLLEAYHLPLFVMGAARTIGHFKSITHNASHVVEFIQGDFENLSEAALHKIMEPYVADWKKVLQADLLNQVVEAIDQNRLSVGIQQVWKASSQHRGKLLITSKNFMYPAVYGAGSKNIVKYDSSLKNAFYIKDAVDDIIEKVLSSGGDVEFVDEQLLEEYGKIVLIEFYTHV